MTPFILLMSYTRDYKWRGTGLVTAYLVDSMWNVEKFSDGLA